MKNWKRIVSVVVAFVLLVTGIRVGIGTVKASNATDIAITDVSGLEQHTETSVRLRIGVSGTFTGSDVASGLGELITLEGMGDTFSPTDSYGWVTEGESQILFIYEGISIQDVSSVPEGAKITFATGTFIVAGSTYRIQSEFSMTYRNDAWKEEIDISLTSVSGLEQHADSAVRLRIVTSEPLAGDGVVSNLSSIVQLTGMGDGFTPTGHYGWATAGESQILLIYEGITFAQVPTIPEGAKFTVATGVITVGAKSYHVSEGFSMTYQNGAWVKDVVATDITVTGVSQPADHFGSGVRFDVTLSTSIADPDNGAAVTGVSELVSLVDIGDNFSYDDNLDFFAVGNTIWVIMYGVTLDDMQTIASGAKLQIAKGVFAIGEENYRITEDYLMTYQNGTWSETVNATEVTIAGVSQPVDHFGIGVRFNVTLSEQVADPDNGASVTGLGDLVQLAGTGDEFPCKDEDLDFFAVGNTLWLIMYMNSDDMNTIDDGATLSFAQGVIMVGGEPYNITTNVTMIYQADTGVWVSNIPPEDDDDEDESNYTSGTWSVYDLYELENLSSLTIPENDSLYNLTNLAKQSNVGLRMKIEDMRGEVAFGLAKHIANNVWAISGYEIIVGANGDYVKIFTMENDGSEPLRAEVSGLNTGASFTLEFGVIDLYPSNGGTDVVARRIYVKMDDADVLEWIDTDMDRTLGGYVPVWAQYETIVSSVDYVGYELRSATPNVQDISELNDGLATFTSVPTRETLVGRAKNATNNAIRMKVKLNAPIENETDELYLNFSNNSKLGIWAGEDGGYNIIFRPGTIIAYPVGDDSVNAQVNYDYPNDEFILEIGVYDQDVYKDGKKVSGYSRNVYVKVDGEEVLTMVHKDTEYKLGTNLWVYSSENIKADLISLTTDRYLIRKTPIVHDLYDISKLSKVSLTPMKEQGLGELSASTNVALRTRVKASSDSEEILVAFAKTAKDKFWDVDESGWEFWIRPASGTIYISIPGSDSQAFCGMDIPEEFILEIGERDVRYNDGKSYGRELYVAIDGTEVLRHVDKDNTRKIGKYVATYMSPANATVSLESLTTKGYIPVEKDIDATDIYDISGYASRTLNKYENYLGELNSAKNSAVKMKVNVDPKGDLFGISLGKTVKDKTNEDSIDANVSGWNIWFWPEYDTVRIEYGNYNLGASFEYEYPEFDKGFELEVGSQDVYYENGKYYGYEVYVKIDGEKIGSWLDEGIAKRKLGTYVLGYTSPKTNCVLSTLYPTTTLRVEYLVNGEVSEPVDAITAETQVVVNKPSKITIATKLAETYSVKSEGVFLNDTLLTAIEVENPIKDAEVFEITAKKGDKIVLKLQRRELTVDEPTTIMDLYDVSGQKALTVQGLSNGGVGNMIQDGERKRTNSAFRFKVTVPEDGSIRWGMYSDMSTAWGYNAFIGRISAGQVGLYNMIYSEKNLVQTNAIEAGKTYYVECGMVKCYEEGNYKYNRWYISLGESLEKLEQVCWYDSRERASYGSTISFIGQDYEETFTVYSTYDVKSIQDVSTQANKDKLATYTVYRKERPNLFYPESVVEYKDASKAKKPANIKLCPKEGMELASLIVSGVNVINNVVVTETGECIYELPSVTKDITFSYTIRETD